MNEDQMHRLMMVAGMTLTIVAGLSTIGLLIATALQYSFATLFSSVLLAGVTVASGWATSFYGHKVTGHPLVFTNEAEREVLTPKQRRELRRARGEVVFDRAITEVEHERQNIVHRQLEESHDDEKPPYETQWTQKEAEVQRQLQARRNHDHEEERY
jgi:hypothetical protein